MKINIKSEKLNLLVLVVFKQPLHLLLPQKQGVLMHPFKVLFFVL